MARAGGRAISPRPDEDRRIERQWLRLIDGGEPGTEVRPLVRESWHRSRDAGVPPELPRAPVGLDQTHLALARENIDLLPVVREITRLLPSDFNQQRHLLGVFDAAGRMLASEGDPRARDPLAEINFAPGGLWDESATGTNGPGTALASGQPVHIIGPEHYCEAWRPWHCAAAPIHDPLSGDIAGVLDISGPTQLASPQIFHLALALALAAECSLGARHLQRRCGILRVFGEWCGRYPGEVIIAADRSGRVLAASPGAPHEFHPGQETSGPIRLAISALIEEAADEAPRNARGLLPYDDAAAVVYPVFDGTARIGGCLLLRRIPRGRPTAPPRRRPTRYSFLDLLGQSPGLAEACRIAGAAAANHLPVFILGESGVGKELFAQSIHSASERRDRPFVPVNCGALAPELVESELFGYVGGAFSGARREGSPGKFEAADGGTIFLDEVGELPPGAQTALLRVLQEGEITRVGATQARAVDVRVIAATNRDLRTALAQGSMRRDLYYRLNVLTLELPPLRERREDIPLLARRFLDVAGATIGRRGLELDAEVMTVLQSYDWPGNVRELQNLMARLVALTSSARITVGDLPAEIRGKAPPSPPIPSTEARWTPQAHRRSADSLAHERAELLALIESTSTMNEAAARLGVTRSTLYRRLERCGLRPKRLFSQS